MMDEIIDFIIQYGGGVYSNYNRENLREIVGKHLTYNTFTILRNKEDKIIAVARWNIYGTVAHILDVIVKKENRNMGILNVLVSIGWTKFPFVKFISFERETKYPNRKSRIYRIEQFLRKGF